MPFIGIMRFGILLFLLGLAGHFFLHSWWPVLVLCGVGAAIVMVMVVIWSLDSSGDASFS